MNNHNFKDNNFVMVEPTLCYLELARSMLKVNFENNVDAEKSLYTLVSITIQTYLFSYLSVVSFINSVLIYFWNDEKKLLHKKFPNAVNFEHLMNSDLKETKVAIKELCDLIRIPRIHIKNPNLWNDFTQVLQVIRDFLVHVKFDENSMKDLNKIVNHLPKDFPSRVASEIIRYFYVESDREVPNWVEQNEYFVVDKIKILLN